MVVSKKTKKSGFTLIEILVAISIMMIMLAITINMTKSLNDTVELENASKNVDLKIRTAKTRSIGSLGDTNYGIHFETNRVVVFEGNTFNNLDTGNEVFVLPEKIKIYDILLDGVGDDIVFDRLTGNTVNFGSVGFRVASDVSKTRQIFINSGGQSSFSSFATSSGPALSNARHTHFNLGLDIGGPNNIILKWYDIDSPYSTVNKTIAATEFFATNRLNWEDTINESFVNQKITINSWLDADIHTVIDVIRHDTENDKLEIYFDLKHIATYENIGDDVDVTLGSFGGVMSKQ